MKFGPLKRGLLKRGLRLAAVALLIPAYAWGADTLPEAATGRSEVKGGTAKSYMVVAANPLAADAGAAIIKAGGNAIDAAIAVQLVLNIVEPQSSGIGGGSFIVYWDAKTKTLHSYDGRETAPAAARENRFLTQDGKPMGRMQAIVGGKSVGVPGTLRVLELAHQAYGKLPWAKDFEPAIKLATDGFAVSPRLHALLAGDSAFQSMEEARKFYYQADGSPLPAGTLLKSPAFATTLRTIASGGADAFYNGKIAEDIVRTVTSATKNPSDMTIADMKGYKAVERPPVCGFYRGHKICGMGPPSSGAVGVLQSLGALERFDLRKLGQGSAEAEHLLIEAGRLALADRAVYLADPDRIPVPTQALVAPGYIKERSALIDPAHRMQTAPAGKIPVKGAQLIPADSPELPSTSHFSIVDKDGNALAMTTTVESAFGSRLMVDGFILNNQLTDFSYEDVAENRTVANRVEGGKRPRSSMSPTIVFDAQGKPEMVLGSPLGAAIVGIVVKALVALIDWQLPPDAAAAVPGALFIGNGVMLEEGLAKAEAGLKERGHNVRIGDYASGLHIITIAKDGTLRGGADPRREGTVVGE
ncbi:MAG: gamma-glutamyltransferase [Rhodospirillaceae bacterium]|nr:gamma-glutamyltransferase [Rhodospirillaceae bacterium]